MTAVRLPTAARRVRACIRWSTAAARRRGSDASREQCVVLAGPTAATVLIVDGAGTVPESMAACAIVIDLIRRAEGPHTSGIPLIRRCHERLIGTRGALVALAKLDVESQLLTWVAIGGIAGLVIRAGPRARPPTEVLGARAGLAGVELPLLSETTVPMAPGDLLVVASDGIRDDFGQGIRADAPPATLAMRILAEHARGTDDALVLVARYLGRAAEGPERSASRRRVAR